MEVKITLTNNDKITLPTIDGEFNWSPIIQHQKMIVLAKRQKKPSEV